MSDSTNTQATSPTGRRGTLAYPGWSWVPIRSLGPRHRARIAHHLLQLDDEDRHLRFGQVVHDAQITHYVESIDFDRDEVFGIFNRRLHLIAMAHLAHAPPPVGHGSEAASVAEFGVSVLRHGRGRGFGGRLFERAVLHARNRGVDTLVIHALSENVVMLKIARRAGAQVVRDGPESQARLKLPPETLGTRFGELVEGQAAEIDFQFKVQARRFSVFMDAISEVKTHIRKSSGAATE